MKLTKNICLALGFWAAAPSVHAQPIFAAQQVPAHQYTGGWEHYVGGGLAVFDCDGDHRPDLFAAGGESAPSLWRNTSQKGGDISFEKRSVAALDLSRTTGAYPIDIDSDGALDLVVLRVGEDVILRGLPGCTFEPMALPGLSLKDQWSTAFSATWEGDNALPTLAFGHYVDRHDPDGPFEACDDNLILRPNGISYAPLQLRPGHCALSMLFSDWGRQGKIDLRVSNDRHYYVNDGAEQMWEMTTPPRQLGEADGWIAHKLWGMGIASGDLDRNGLGDVFLSSMGDQRLQEWTGEGAGFRDVPFTRGTAAQRPHVGGDGRPSTGWHISFGDVQNDGLEDVFIAKGNVQQMPGMAMKDPNNLLIQDDFGNFSEASEAAGVASLHRSRGAALVDLNNDGRLDLAVVNRVAQMELYKNTTAQTGNWISVELAQNAPNTRAVGAWIELQDEMGLQAREIMIGGGHAGGMAGPQHFGVGEAEAVRLRVIWPGGVTSDWIDVLSNQRLRLTRGQGNSLQRETY